MSTRRALATQLLLPLDLFAVRDERDFSEALSNFRRLPYRQGPYSARNWGHPLHSLCSYASKMKPGLAHWLVALFTRPGDTVLDPFSGSGTIPFEACLAGRRGIGMDLSPLGYTLTVAKVRVPSPSAVAEMLAALEQWLASTMLPCQDLPEAEDEIKDFYHPLTFSEILCARRFLQIQREASYADAVPFVAACLSHILHGNRPYALSRRSHGVIPIPPKGPTLYKPLMPALRSKVRRMLIDSLPPHYRRGEAYCASASEMPLPDNAVDAVITSPPFLGTTEFLRQNRLRLWFLGWSYEVQRARRKDFLEYARDMSDYLPVLREIRRVARAGALLVFHLGVVNGFDMAERMAELAQQLEMERLAVVYEDATHLESHGRTDRGATAQHAFLFLRS